MSIPYDYSDKSTIYIEEIPTYIVKLLGKSSGIEDNSFKTLLP